MTHGAAPESPPASPLTGEFREITDQDFRTLYRNTRGSMRRAVSFIVGPHGDVDDLVQEAYLKAWLNLGRYSPTRGTLAAWLHAIARNCAIDSLRRASTRPHCITAHGPDEDGMPYDRFATTARACGEALDFKRAQAAIENCLASLPAHRADSVRMSFFEDLAHPEIAQRRDAALGTVKSHIRRSLLELRAPLAAYAGI